MRTRLFIAAAGLVVLAAGAPLVAHHAFAAEFDGSKPVTLKGTVTKMEWINPHAWLHVDVKGPDGKMVSWMVEGGAPNALLRRGWNRNSVVAGTTVVVAGLSGEGWFEPGEWTGRDAARREEAVHRLVRNGRAGRRPRFDGKEIDARTDVR